jgi:hypothetical protein
VRMALALCFTGACCVVGLVLDCAVLAACGGDSLQAMHPCMCSHSSAVECCINTIINVMHKVTVQRAACGQTCFPSISLVGSSADSTSWIYIAIMICIARYQWLGLSRARTA